MRLALLAPLPPEQNGIADYAAAFRQALTACGVKVKAPFAGQRLPAEPSALARLMADVDWAGYDLVHAELGGGRSGEFLALEWLVRKFPRLPLTATVHDPERLIWKPPATPKALQRLPAALFKALVLLLDPLTVRRERRLAARLSRLVTLTATGRASLLERMQLPAARVTCIPHGNQSIPPRPLPALPPHGRLRLLYFGFIYRGKGIEDLIDALAWLEQRQPGASRSLSLTLAGGTQPGMAFAGRNDYLDFLRQRLAKAGLRELDVKWRLDLPAAEIAEVIQMHHLLVLPYRESARLALMGRMRGTSGGLSWAAACGRGVITSNARSFGEEVSHGNGWVYPQGDVQALAQRLSAVLAAPEQVIACSEAATVLGRERQWQRVGPTFHQLFQDVQGEAVSS